jgi:hypothetical protein
MQSDVLLMMIREGRSQVTLKKKEQNERQKEKNTKKTNCGPKECT